MKRNILSPTSVLVALSICFSLFIPVRAQPAEGTTGATTSGEPKSWAMEFLTRDYMLGDWGGLRTELSGRGIDFEFFYAGSVPSNVSGGIKRGSVYEGALLMMLDLDSQKLAGYEGGHFHVGSLYLHGNDHFSDNHTGDLNKVNLIDFPNTFRLWEL